MKQKEGQNVKKLDVRGAKCPIPIIKAKKEMDSMAPGEQLEVLSTDPGSVPDFQGWVKVNKKAALNSQRTEKDETGREVYVHLLERLS
ncbi:MAG TPA: sulfurtransferase TusA family protein [Myxococcaceae bacterium]|nr:sulfurtransferase TusA family protein [Myxococcaceae bacterium]